MGEGKKKDGRQLNCEVCDEQFRVPPSMADDARFCSEECKNSHLGDQWTGDQNPRWTGGDVTVVCEWCGEEYEVRPAKESTTTHCSLECKGEAYAVERKGEGSPSWEGGDVTVECEWCGEEYGVRPAKKSETRFCSRECQAEAQTEQTGQDHPNWQGGYTLYRALRQQLSDASWRRIREEETAAECAVCGTEDDLHLHHIIPLKRGGTNEAWNLLTLCRTHHKYAEEYTKDSAPSVLQPVEELGG